jgi:hypothetical protein
MQVTKPFGVRQGQEEECLLAGLRQRIMATIPKPSSAIRSACGSNA